MAKKTPLLLAAGLLVVLMVGLGAVYFLSQRSQDVRNQASVKDGLVKVTSSWPSEGVASGSPATIELFVTTSQANIDSIQLVGKLSGPVAEATFTPSPQLQQIGLQPTITEFNSGEFRLVFTLIDPSKAAATVEKVNIGAITVKPSADGQVSLSFDQDQSLSSLYKQATDTLSSDLPTIAFSIGGASPSPKYASPTPSPVNCSYDETGSPICPSLAVLCKPPSKYVMTGTNACGCQVGTCLTPEATPEPEPSPYQVCDSAALTSISYAEECSSSTNEPWAVGVSFACSDGHTETMGGAGSTSCKAVSTWKAYANDACKLRLICRQVVTLGGSPSPVPSATTATIVTPPPTPLSTPLSSPYIYLPPPTPRSTPSPSPFSSPVASTKPSSIPTPVPSPVSTPMITAQPTPIPSPIISVLPVCEYLYAPWTTCLDGVQYREILSSSTQSCVGDPEPLVQTCPMTTTCQTNADCGPGKYCYQPPMPDCPPGAYCAQVMPATECRLLQTTADLNGDGKVDLLDISIVITAISNHTAAGDLNGDGNTNILDYSQMIAYFLNGSLLTSPSPVVTSRPSSQPSPVVSPTPYSPRPSNVPQPSYYPRPSQYPYSRPSSSPSVYQR